MAYTSDDDIIRRRLLIDGEGGNDDKRLNNLLKTFIRWSTMKEDDENSQAMYQRMQAMIGQCEYTLEKAMNTYEMNKQELENYEKLSKEIDDKIEEATKRISEAKQELQLAKCIRKNRQEYDNLAKIIQQQPDRQETTKQLEALDKELSTLAKTRQQLEEKLELRRKQFMVLITSIHELQSILEADDQTNDENKDEDTNMSS
ncbi:THO complex subunit 7 homolog isoform X2 [Biomphalaria glabrata]|uniref:THO complex subunit 7 homolog isoform X2 n=1 Tax=Biomphalaria glabrata TaxID=6526 RepID=A0A2C9LHM3_BIOGL|nr:THO complex subunit 7 homolog isoform X2 [Biomphalaria glabrata]KAI8781610.1 THO complex subunit 7 isoform X2 [Biomphalaria glabrata]